VIVHRKYDRDIRLAGASLRRWLLEEALPFWTAHGIDREFGGFHDLLDMRSGAVASPIKRTFVQARQIYVLCESHTLGWKGQWRDAVTAGLAILDGAFRRPDWGYVQSIGEGNAVYETRRDLYDQAFVAFGKAAAARMPIDHNGAAASLIESARGLLTRVETEWALPTGGFYEGELRPRLPRRQNPLMHLFEASIALAVSSGESRDLSRANSIARFAIEKLIDVEHGYLPEFFNEEWLPFESNNSIMIEPGHQFEWAWLLCRLARLGGDDHRGLAERLWRFAISHGVDAARGVAVDAIDSWGTTSSNTARLWPQAERLKAALAMLEYGVGGAERETFDAMEGLNKYLRAPLSGAYHDTMLLDGTFVNEPARASSLYHIVGAMSEERRIIDGPNVYP
jgi:mannose-6-phosphate isomerase